MSASPSPSSFDTLFRTVEHVAPAQHIREFPFATIKPDDTLHLAVKQYIPLENGAPQPGDVTIIGGHANGFPKELYEPLWEDLLVQSRGKFRIRSIWMADVAWQGQSGVLNEQKLGNDPSWMDPARDLLHFINLKREEFPRPIVGIGHSMGGCHLVNLALTHPRLLHSIVLVDPVIAGLRITEKPKSYHGSKSAKPSFNILTTTQASTYRRDLWPSREAAAHSFRKSPFYKAWDPRVLERWIQYGLRELPTALHPLPPQAPPAAATDAPAATPVTLTTTKHQEVFTFSRPAYSPAQVSRLTHPDFVPGVTGGHPFYRAEPNRVFAQLPFLRPSVLYLFAGDSDLSAPEERADKLRLTGTGPGGSGGAAEGRVAHYLFEGVGHMVPMERAAEVAQRAAGWLDGELARFSREEATLASMWAERSPLQKTTMGEDWYAHVPKPTRPPKTPAAENAAAKPAAKL